MFAIFWHAFARSRWAIVGWGLSLALLAVYLMPFYDTLAKQQETLESLLSSYPPELLAFFGASGDVTAFFTPEGYLSLEFFSYLPLILGIFALLAGSGLLVADEENGALDLVLAHPISRTALFLGRGLAWLASLSSILILIWLGLATGQRWSTIDFSLVALARPFLSLLAVLLVFGTFGLLLSMLLPSRRLAATVAGLTLVASFFVTSLARLDEGLEPLAKFSPLNYYQSGEAILGLKGEWLAGSLAVALAFSLLAWWRFERRDVRVGGEGGWRFPILRRRARAAA